MRNRPNVLTLLTTLAAAAGCVALASPSFAQQTRPGEVMGMRYLSWSGKAAAPADGLRRSVALTPAPIPVAADNSRYPAVQTASRPSRYSAGTSGLTPASVWTGGERPASAVPAPALEAAPPAQQPDPALQAQAQAEYQAKLQADYQAWYQSQAQAQYEAQVRDMPQPQPQPQVVQMPASEQHAATQQGQPAEPQPLQPQQQLAETRQQAEPQYEQRADAGSPPTLDPMAPRRDALIFRMQQPQSAPQSPAPQAPADQPQPTPSSDAQSAASAHEIQQPVLSQPAAGRTYSGQAYAGAEPPRESARYYSVHRGEGRQPDPIAMPQSVYLDNAPIDLAEPPAAPIPGRTVNGRTQVIVPNQDPSLP